MPMHHMKRAGSKDSIHKENIKEVDDHIKELKEKHKNMWRNSMNMEDFTSKLSIIVFTNIC